MTKRDDSTRTAANGRSASMADETEQKMVAFAEQLGRLVGTVQAKAEGWLDREALNAQISSVRDGAADLLEYLGGGAKAAARPRQAAAQKRPEAAPRTSAAKPSNKGKVPTKVKASATSGAATTKSGQGRSGGAVDAPGKKHRKPMPSEAGATGAPRGAGARIAKLKMTNETRRTRQRG